METLQRFYAQKKILVTGGAGFIGSHIVEKLVTYGARVTVLDNFSSGTLANLKSVVHTINLMYADVRCLHSCAKASENQDFVFHLASLVSVPESIKNQELCYKINIDGTRNILEACRKNNVKRFIFSSSSAVYGNKNTVCKETTPLNPQSPYAESKVVGENLCHEYNKKYGLSSVILRYFNVYGERQNPKGPYAAVVARFKQQLLNAEPLTIFGDGKQTRDFIPVSDVVHANLKLAMAQTNLCETFNIGTGKSITLLELINQLENELQTRRTTINFLPAREGDILHSKAYCEKYHAFTL
jgi:nucleoside-diphosphate-sugar epimerase